MLIFVKLINCIKVEPPAPLGAKRRARVGRGGSSGYLLCFVGMALYGTGFTSGAFVAGAADLVAFIFTMSFFLCIYVKPNNNVLRFTV